MIESRANALLRLSAFAIDWSILALWGGLLFAVVMLATDGDPPRPAGPWAAQSIGFLTMTLPFTLYFAICESSRLRGSFGKRAVGLRALRLSGESLSFRRALVRNAIKFVPWEFGHTLAQQAAFGSGDHFPAWLWGPAVIATVGPLCWLVTLFLTGQTPYDRWIRATVNRPSPRLAPPTDAAT